MLLQWKRWSRSRLLILLIPTLALFYLIGTIFNDRFLVRAAFSVANLPRRQIHQTIETLKQNGLSIPDVYQSTTDSVVKVLEQWSEEYANTPEWKSLLNKRNLCHEVEESIIALHHLQEWRSTITTSTTSSTCSNNDTDTATPFIVLDACCGKGIFSALLSYMAPPGLSRIILLDRDANVNWSYMEAANSNHEQEGRPFLEMLPGTNLHDHDTLVDKLASYNTPVAVTGIHLCKTLSPTLVGIVNALGPDKAPYFCLAPCCLPRKQQQLQIAQYEAPLQRQARLTAARNRKAPRKRGCYVCQGSHHIRDCPQRELYATFEEWNQAVKMTLMKLPCWNCGKVGHPMADCTEPIAKMLKQPHMLLEMSTDIYPTQEDPSLQGYCEALAGTLQQLTATIVDSGLTTTSHEPKGQQGSSNWNRNRKALFIVATS